MEVQREATPWILMTCVSLAETWAIKKECLDLKAASNAGKRRRREVATRVDCSGSSIENAHPKNA